MVPDLIWAPDLFGLQEIWALGNLGPGRFGTWEIWSPKKFGPLITMPYIDFCAEPKFLRVQNSWGPNKSGDQMRSGTISVIAVQSMQIWHATFSPIATRWEISRQDLMQLSYV